MIQAGICEGDNGMKRKGIMIGSIIIMIAVILVGIRKVYGMK